MYVTYVSFAAIPHLSDTDERKVLCHLDQLWQQSRSQISLFLANVTVVVYHPCHASSLIKNDCCQQEILEGKPHPGTKNAFVVL